MAEKHGLWSTVQTYAIRIGGGVILALQAMGHKDWMGLAFPKGVDVYIIYALSYIAIVCIIPAGVTLLEMINWKSPKDIMRAVNNKIDEDEHEQHRP